MNEENRLFKAGVAFCFSARKIPKDVFLGLFAFELSMRLTKFAAVENVESSPQLAAVGIPAFRLCAYGLRGFFNPYSSVRRCQVTCEDFFRENFAVMCCLIDWKNSSIVKPPGLLLECL